MTAALISRAPLAQDFPVPEITAQLATIWRERRIRLPLTALGIGLAAIFLPVWVCVVAMTGTIGFDLASMILMRGVTSGAHRTRYRMAMVCHFVMELFYGGVAALVWLSDDPSSAPFAVGMVMTTLLHLSTVRAIHLPFGLAALAGVAIPVLGGNGWSWIRDGNMPGLALSTLCALVGLSYALTAMVATNRLYREAALGRASAQAGYEAKNRFLAQMSHELRTPLNAILGMGHAEMRRNRDELSRERLSVLITAAEGLSTILDDVLDMAAVQEGRLPIRPRIAHPLEEIRTTVALFRPGIEAAGLDLHTDYAPTLEAPALFDTQRLRQCLSNLLSNALKNTATGHIDVAVDLVTEGRTGRLLRIAVTDTGPGIAPHLRGTIFEPFQRMAQSGPRRIATSPGSNGLGLSICHALARQMGGDLVLADAPGAAQGAAPGVRFILTIAIEASASPHLPATPPVRAPVADVAVDAGGGIAGLRVLVVDDIATNRLVAITYLRMLGAQPLVVPGGDAALKRLGTEDIDLVLLDMNMPEMDGIETLRRIRALPGQAGRSLVIAMTADAGEDHRERYGREGLDGYLAKPINPDRIEAEYRAAVRRRARADATDSEGEDSRHDA